MSQTKWSYTKLNASRQCKRKFFFKYMLKTHGRKNPLRRKAFELGKMKNLEMWQGSVVDQVMTEIVIPAISEARLLDFDALAEQAVELAKKQFSYSEKKLYRLPTPKKKDKTAEQEELEPCILDVHELNKPVDEVKVLECYNKIGLAILNIPVIRMPGSNMLLLDFLKASKPLIPNVQSWDFKIEGIRVNPQIDLVGYHNFQPFVIDWKVSESLSSDYYKQLAICGMTVYFKRMAKVESEGKSAYAFEDIKLYKVNLLKAEVEEYLLTEEDVNNIIDDVNLTGGDIEAMEDKKWNEVDMASLPCTENEVNCRFCNFKSLCSFLYLNNHQYDEKNYLQSVQDIEPAHARLFL